MIMAYDASLTWDRYQIYTIEDLATLLPLVGSTSTVICLDSDHTRVSSLVIITLSTPPTTFFR